MVVAIAQVLVVTCGRVVGFVVYLFVVIDPNCSVNVGVKLQGGDGARGWGRVAGPRGVVEEGEVGGGGHDTVCEGIHLSCMVGVLTG